MKTKLQTALAALAPSISIRTLWEYDDNPEDTFGEPGWWNENESPEDWQAWQSEIRATTVHEGEEVTGSAYLGGTWEKAGDDPAESNPEISGYELQMTVEALEELSGQLNGGSPAAVSLRSEISRAVSECRRQMRESYEAQRREREEV